MATVNTVTRAVYCNIGGGGQRNCSSLYNNISGTRKTVSSAYGNINGSRKQIFPYAYKTTYSYKQYSVTSWTMETYNNGNDCCTNYMYDKDAAYKSYSFNNSTGTFTLSTKMSYTTVENEGDDVFGSYDEYNFSSYPVYISLHSNRRIIAAVSHPMNSKWGAWPYPIYRAKPSAYGSSYTTISSTTSKTTGYQTTRVELYNVNSTTGEFSSEYVACYTGYYLAE